MRIKDPIHGIIHFSELEKAIIDHPLFQRLRKIKQLGLTYMVYPGAHHTRFEHSLGVMHLSGIMARAMGLDVQKARLLGLLHDLGHVAFSHDGEMLLERFGFKSHEELGMFLTKNSEIGDVISEHYNLKNFFRSREERIVSCSIGSDRIDYLKRDALYTGVAYGVIEDDILIDSMFLEKGKLCIKESALEALESFFIGRFMMFNAVYLHKTVRVLKQMLSVALNSAYEKGIVQLDDLLNGDEHVFSLLRIAEPVLARRIEQRQLMKVAFKTKKPMSIRGCLLSQPPKVVKKEDIFVKTKEGTLKKAEHASTLIASLKKAEKEKSKYLVICEEEEVDRIRRRYSGEAL